MFPLTIKEVQDEKELKLLLNFMKKQKQYYPKYDEWLHEKCKPRIETGQYRTLVSIADGEITGDVVWTPLNKDDIEIRNLRIDPNYQNRALGTFLLRQIEVLQKNIFTDVSANNFSAVEFFILNGFKIRNMAHLYTQKVWEFELEKLQSFKTFYK